MIEGIFPCLLISFKAVKMLIWVYISLVPYLFQMNVKECKKCKESLWINFLLLFLNHFIAVNVDKMGILLLLIDWNKVTYSWDILTYYFNILTYWNLYCYRPLINKAFQPISWLYVLITLLLWSAIKWGF